MKIDTTHQTQARARKIPLPALPVWTKTVLHMAGIGIVWSLLAFFAFIDGLALGWIALAAAVMGKGPNLDGLGFGLISIALTIALTFLAGRLAGSMRRAGLFTATVIGFVLVGFAIWAPLHPQRAVFLARAIAWGPSEVRDYLKFPDRPITNGAPNFQFKQASEPWTPPIIEYTSEGEARRLGLEEMLDATNTTSFIVIKDDVILYEGYFNGYRRDSIVTSFSMAKSFTSALVGIAIGEGHIGGVNDLVIDYLPELKGRGLDNLTIRHLLNMSSGIRYFADDEVPFLVEMFQFTDDGLSYSYPDLRSQALNLQPGKPAVGAEFNYNNYHLQLLGLILERTTGMPPAEYLQEKIWKLLGMEYPGSWSLDSEETSFEIMTAGINARAIDFARFGRLFLNKGNWEGRQVVPEAWVVESTAPDPDDDRPWHSAAEWKNAGGYYKYLWWGVHRPDGTYDFVARGHLGQRIYVAPAYGMVIVRFGFDEGGVDSWEYVMMDIIADVTHTESRAPHDGAD